MTSKIAKDKKQAVEKAALVELNTVLKEIRISVQTQMDQLKKLEQNLACQNEKLTECINEERTEHELLQETTKMYEKWYRVLPLISNLPTEQQEIYALCIGEIKKARLLNRELSEIVIERKTHVTKTDLEFQDAQAKLSGKWTIDLAVREEHWPS